MAQIFPEWMNETPKMAAIGTVVLGGVASLGLWWWGSPKHTDVGYMPKQPIEYSHKLHAGTLEMDCRYCHAYVERSPHAGVPSTQTCMNCHAQVKKDSPKLAALRDSWADGKGDKSIRWVRIHKVPDFAYFDHSAHVGVGVGQNRAAIGCETCHGSIDEMDVVKQEKPLSMAWCIDCHTAPTLNLRPVDKMTTMRWLPDPAWRDQAARIAKTLDPPGNLNATRLNPAGDQITVAAAGCTGCHR
ncbi:MAG: cytochrome c3 family protein [Deltaproteobacteria bacterium]|nr:cytochrome c3 family protein [Deltaproteobacteria bacterium]